MAETLQKNVDGNGNDSVTKNSLKIKIKAIFFDLDNTLIPTRSGDTKTCRKLAEVLENQFAFTKDESAQTTQTFLKSFRRCPDNSQTSLDSWRIYLWREALPSRSKYLAEQIYSQWLQLRYRYLAMQPDYIQMLKCFRERGLYLALITNGPSNAQWEKIKKLKVRQYFDCVLVSSDLPWEKPNPHIFHAACNFLQVKPNECVMVGDKLESDIKGGCLAQLGVTFWLPLNSQNDADLDLRDISYKPDYVIKSVLDLYKYFPVNGSSSLASGGINHTLFSSIASTSAANVAAQHQQPQQQQQMRYRISSISRSSTTSTCDSDHLQLSSNLGALQSQQQDKDQSTPRYRRGGSLPAIESFPNSENENSSDSIN